MALYSANAVQTLEANDGVVFTETVVPCNCGYIIHQDGSSSFKMRGVPGNRQTRFEVHFQANVALSDDVAPISIALVVDGEVVPSSLVIITPAAIDEYWNVHTDVELPIYSPCCSSVSVRNISDAPIDMQNASLRIQKVGA